MKERYMYGNIKKKCFESCKNSIFVRGAMKFYFTMFDILIDFIP